MSVRLGILAVLRLGPAYGLQLHGEVEFRTQRIGKINVGQIYSTLDRLQIQGLVVQSGRTRDGLPLYALTPTGDAEVGAWLAHPVPDPGWADFVAHLLMSASLPQTDTGSLIAGYREYFLSASDSRGDAAGTPGPGAEELSALAGHASRLQRHAALSWLDVLESELDSASGLARPLGELRPRRGRRPRSTRDGDIALSVAAEPH